MVDVPLVRSADAHAHPSTAHDGREGVEDGHAHHDDWREKHRKRRSARIQQDSDQTQREAEEQGARISQEYFRRIEIPAQEAQRRTDQRGCHDGGHKMAAHAGNGEQRDAADGRNSRGEAVNAVDKVDNVSERHKQNNGQRIRNPAEIDQLSRKGIRNASNNSPRRNGKTRRHDLPEELV